MKTQENKQKTLRMAELGILLALVVVLQSIFSIGFINICLCLVPITLGAILLDWKGGAALGVAFGVVAAFWGIMGKDLFTFYLFSANPAMTIVICLVKGALAGIAPALIYKWLSGYEYKNSKLVASIVASLSAPIVNTGIFALGCAVIKNDVIEAMLNLGEKLQVNFDVSNFFTLLFVTIIGTNFFLEFFINAVFSPALNRLVAIIKKNKA